MKKKQCQSFFYQTDLDPTLTKIPGPAHVIKLPFVIKIFVFPIFAWPFNTGLKYSKFSFLSDKQLEMQ